MLHITSCVILVIVIWVVALCTLWWLQYRILFYPNRDIVWSPTNYPGHEELYLSFDNVVSRERPLGGDYLSVWKFVHNPRAKTVLFCHGNSGNITHRGYIVHLCKLFGLNITTFDYRGYGKSSGYSNIKTLHQDADLIREYITKEVEPSNLILWGESLGGALATYIATKCQCFRLVLMATFSSLDDILVYKEIRFANVISKVLRLLMNTMPSKERIINTNCPVVITHSVEDELIPFACSEKLFSSVQGDKLLIPIRGGHASPILTVKDIRVLMRFMEVTECYVSDSDIERSIEEIRTVLVRYDL